MSQQRWDSSVLTYVVMDAFSLLTLNKGLCFGSILHNRGPDYHGRHSVQNKSDGDRVKPRMGPLFSSLVISPEVALLATMGSYSCQFVYSPKSSHKCIRCTQFGLLYGIFFQWFRAKLRQGDADSSLLTKPILVLIIVHEIQKSIGTSQSGTILDCQCSWVSRWGLGHLTCEFFEKSSWS